MRRARRAGPYAASRATPVKAATAAAIVSGSAGLMPNRSDLAKRAALWELSTATSFLYSGADVLIMYHPEAARAIQRTITQLMDQKGPM